MLCADSGVGSLFRAPRLCRHTQLPWACCTDDDDVEFRVLGFRLTYWGQTVTSAEAWFSVDLRPQKP